MNLTEAIESEFDRLLEIWEAAVRATHTFLTEGDINFYRPQIREKYFYQVKMTVARDEKGRIMGFMGVTPPEAEMPARVEMLFVDPVFHGQGAGRALIMQAAAEYGPLELEVNEQNPGAGKFYQNLGFKTIGRWELDGQGRPFPLLHLRREG
jgi:Acetyltransferases